MVACQPHQSVFVLFEASYSNPFTQMVKKKKSKTTESDQHVIYTRVLTAGGNFTLNI